MTSMTDAGGNVTTYGYDATGQLTQVTLPGGATITYVYNAAGDRTEVINSGTPTSYSSNADNEITQVGSTTYTYDANGNLHTVTDASGTTTYTYNDLNQLVSITAPDGTVTTFQYSPLGFLVGENVNGTQTNYLVDPTGLGNVVASYNGSGSLIADYNYGLGLVSQTGPSGTGYYDFDASGNTVGITGSSGTYVNQYSYLPFGETTTISAALPNPFTFAGQVGVMQIGDGPVLHASAGLHASTGQFVSNDPIGLHGGDTNMRRYVCNNDPTDLVDPTGDSCSSSGLPDHRRPVQLYSGFLWTCSTGLSRRDSAGNSIRRRSVVGQRRARPLPDGLLGQLSVHGSDRRASAATLAFAVRLSRRARCRLAATAAPDGFAFGIGWDDDCCTSSPAAAPTAARLTSRQDDHASLQTMHPKTPTPSSAPPATARRASSSRPAPCPTPSTSRTTAASPPRTSPSPSSSIPTSTGPRSSSARSASARSTSPFPPG